MKITKEISIGDVAARSEELRGENMTLNMGPSHPATHGVLRRATCPVIVVPQSANKAAAKKSL